MPLKVLKKDRNAARRVAFNSHAETAALRRAFSLLRLPDAIQTDVYRDRLGLIQRNVNSPCASKAPKRVIFLPGAIIAIRCSVNGVNILFGTWGQPTIELVARLADATAYFFRDSRTRMPCDFNFSEAQAKEDSENSSVNAVLLKFRAVFESVGIIGENGRSIKPAEEIRTTIIENSLNSLDASVKRLEEKVKKLETSITYLLNSQKGSVVTDAISKLVSPPIVYPSWGESEPQF